MPPEEEVQEETQEETGFQGVEIQDDDNLTTEERDALFSYDPFDEGKQGDLPTLDEIQARGEGEEEAVNGPTSSILQQLWGSIS